MKKPWTKERSRKYQRLYYKFHHSKCVKDMMESDTKRFINKIANVNELKKYRKLINKRLNTVIKESEE